MFIENAKDILYIVLSFAVIWFTIFICWFFYYLIMIVRNVNQTVQEVHHKLQLIDRVANAVREKLEKSSSYLFIIAEGIKQGVGYLMDKKRKRDPDEKE